MRHPLTTALPFAVLALSLASCADAGLLAPSRAPAAALAPATGVHVSEIHYDDASTDQDEKIEVAGPAGTDLTGWSIVLYNGSSTSRAPYDTRALSGVIPSSCGETGVVVVDYAVNGIQNGGPDGIALVDSTGTVVEFISYEGSFVAASGPAEGMTSTDIGVSEGGVPEGQSLQREGASWAGPKDNTFGACNAGAGDGGGDGDGGLIGTGELLSEIRIDQTGSDNDEYFELAGPAGTSLDGLTYLVIGDDGAGSSGVIEAVVSLDGQSIPDRGYFVAAEATFTLGTADLVTSLNFENGDNFTHLVVRGFTGVDGQDLDADDDATLDATPWAEVVDCVSLVQSATSGEAFYCATTVGPDGSFVPGHVYRTDTGWAIGAFDPSGGDDTPGAAPGGGGGGGGSVSIFGRDGGDPPLPVGFQDQLFASLSTDPGATFTWTSETPSLASIDEDGVVTALGVGTAILRATASSGETGTIQLATIVATAGGTARYEGNAEFGVPTDATPGDDFIITRPQYTASYNSTRGTPNWVSYEIDPSHFGDQDRCDCFTPDPALPADYPAISTADYTSSGAFHGYGIDRGHLVRSFDRTTGSLDNAVTYYFSNIVPQAADNNQGPWAALESYLGDLARSGGREVYIVTGVAGNKGTLKNEGRVVIPESVWKVAVIMPRDEGLDEVDDAGDLQVIAVDMPNVAGIRNVSWETYRTSVDAIEALTGYDLLALLPDAVERAVEADLTVVAMDLQPATVSLSRTAVVNAILLSSAAFDAGAVDPAGVRMVVNGDGPGVAPTRRGTSYVSSVRDVNGDGRPDRLVSFSTQSLVAAGLTVSTTEIWVEGGSGSAAWIAVDPTPPTFVP